MESKGNSGSQTKRIKHRRCGHFVGELKHDGSLFLVCPFCKQLIPFRLAPLSNDLRLENSIGPSLLTY